MLLKSTTLEITGRNVLAARLEKMPAIPADGHGRGEGHRNPHHPVGEACSIVLEPDLDPGDQRADACQAGQTLLEAAVSHVLHETIDPDKPVTQPLALRGGRTLAANIRRASR